MLVTSISCGDDELEALLLENAELVYALNRGCYEEIDYLRSQLSMIDIAMMYTRNKVDEEELDFSDLISDYPSQELDNFIEEINVDPPMDFTQVPYDHVEDEGIDVNEDLLFGDNSITLDDNYDELELLDLSSAMDGVFVDVFENELAMDDPFFTWYDTFESLD